ncbi:MAG: hypothetical protein MJY82_08060, partial [Fibrobacter sp.]|nr:hypothetical protein [Fibrobacter sp.]
MLAQKWQKRNKKGKIFSSPAFRLSSKFLYFHCKKRGSLMKILPEALTFDDVLLVPAESSVLPSQTDV